MSCTFDHRLSIPRGAWLTGLTGGVVVALAACGTPGQDLKIQLEPAPVISTEIQIGAEVGRLLGPDPEISKAAEKRLIALTGEALERFLTYARTLEGERDMRLLNVLDEHHAAIVQGIG